MLRLDLNLDYVVDDDDRKNVAFKTNALVSISVLRTAMNNTKGAPNQQRQSEGNKSRDQVRIAARAVNTITKAKNSGADFIELDMLELLHIRDCMESWMKDQGIPESLTPWYELLRDAVDKVIAEGEKQAAALMAAKKNGAATPSVSEAKPATA